MQNKPLLKFIRKPELLALLGISKSTLYCRIKDGLLPPPISLGGRAVGYAEHEIQQVMTSMTAGSTAKELKIFVAQIVNQRKALHSTLHQQFTKLC